jgi:hypothetical protein
MAGLPKWFQQLKWTSPPPNVAVLNQNRGIIPDFPGCYAFTTHNAPLSPGRVLYVGEAARSLRQRLPAYLIDFRKPKITPTTPGRRDHKGRGFVLEARHIHGDQGVYVQWVEYGGAPSDIHILEASLMEFLQPDCNDRDEAARHPTLGDWELLDPRAIF